MKTKYIQPQTLVVKVALEHLLAGGSTENGSDSGTWTAPRHDYYDEENSLDEPLTPLTDRHSMWEL